MPQNTFFFTNWKETYLWIPSTEEGFLNMKIVITELQDWNYNTIYDSN